MFRNDLENKFPIHPLNPLIVTRIVDDKIEHRAYTLSSKEELESFIEENVPPVRCDRTLLGTWAGKWETDVFNLDFNKIFEKVIEYGRSKYKTFKY